MAFCFIIHPIRDVTKTTAYLGEYRKNPHHDKKLSFCQAEALEIAFA
jgi:hypothetical protein